MSRRWAQLVGNAALWLVVWIVAVLIVIGLAWTAVGVALRMGW